MRSTTEILDEYADAGKPGTYTYEVTALRDGEPPATSSVRIAIQQLFSDDLDFDFIHVVESVCTRTAQVRDAIVAAVSGVSDCADITSEHLRSITSLDLSGQGITTLRDTDFANLDLVRTLDLSGNSLTSIPTDGSFYGVSSFRERICGVDYEARKVGGNGCVAADHWNYPGYRVNERVTYPNNVVHEFPVYGSIYGGLAPLKTLDLSDNRISSLPAGWMHGLTKLKKLDLSGNLLTALPGGVFDANPQNSLVSLDLSDNALSSIEASSTVLGGKGTSTFYNLGELQTLDLSGNNLTNLANGTFRGPVWLGTWTGPSLSLKTLDLSDNGMVTAPRKLWDNDCDPNVPNLTIYPGNPVRTCAGTKVYSATMTVGEGYIAGRKIIGWDGDLTTIDGDALTDAAFVYKNETYNFSGILQSSSGLFAYIDDASSGSIDDAAVRKVMTLYIDGSGFPLKDADYGTISNGDHRLKWAAPGFAWAAGDTVELELWVK